ncbi:uncharacterized protein LOC131035158 [Cryptomeria japonica]|uniref:uncharacterized protein LOC131035158 n=1 Tax=Cryptomeria japonica TaxID=3369 RepID=UPI0027DA1D25|nr:uncharacterized protein LOC131035158 [Cryptomeria japonica]
MELDFDADFVEADEESLGTLVRRNSKVERGTNLKENVASDTVKPEMNTNLVTSGGENSDINSASTSLEKAANTCERETKMNTNFGSSDEESSITLVLNISELHTGRNLKESEASGCKTMNSDIEVVFNEVQNSEVKLGGKIFEAEQSQVTTAEHTERHENKEYFDGARLIAYPLSMDASNKSVVLKDMPVDSTHLKASLQPSVYYVEDKGSQINANLDRGSETIEYESKETENQLRENQIRILENSALEGKVEDIVKILKEQQSHDVICPNCGACITERIILRKRKRTSLVSEGNPDGQTAVSEEEHEITEDQSNRLEMSIEHYEETEAYGCLACLHIIIERDSLIVPRTTLDAQPSLESMGWNKEKHDATEMAIGDFWFYNNITFHAARSPYWQIMVDTIIGCGQRFKAPNDEEIKGPILNQKVVDVEAKIAEQREIWRKSCTIVTDGWTHS